MAWVHKSLPANNVEPEPILVGIGLNATSARAVHGPCQVVPSPLALDGDHEDLPMVLSLEGRRAHVGRAGSGLCRQAPHLTCLDFLAYLGERREWAAGRHRLDANKAVALVLEHFQAICAGAKGVVLALPAYLTPAQVMLLPPLAEKARLPLLGSVRGPLASGLAAYTAGSWSGMALVLDVDDHAFTATTMIADGEQLCVHAVQAWPQLNLRAWKGCLLDMVADRCIRQSRRDPRDSALAEQSLYEQLEEALDRGEQGKMVELLIQTANWYQNLLLRPEEMVAFCERLVRRVVDGIEAMLGSQFGRGVLRCVIATRAVGSLPGLVSALQSFVQEQAPATEREPSSDFGEDLIQDGGEPAPVTVLAADALARAAHDLAVRFHRGELPRGQLDLSVPLPTSMPPAAGQSLKRNLRILSPDQ